MKICVFLIFCLLLVGCASGESTPTGAPTALSATLNTPTAPRTSTPAPSDTPTLEPTASPTLTASATPTQTPKKSPTPSKSPTQTTTSTPTPFPTPPAVACARPLDDYARVNIGKEVLNLRTIWMLLLANRLYHGRGNPVLINQGSYTTAIEGSFGTHAGGGAVDVSVYVKGTTQELKYEEEVELVHTLRQAGFAAWLRLRGDILQFNGDHIHAIAVGDREMSPAARQQLDGPEGYFRGLDGVPPDQGGPKPDRYGGPIVCDWMIELGFKDLREPTPTATNNP